MADTFIFDAVNRLLHGKSRIPEKEAPGMENKKEVKTKKPRGTYVGSVGPDWHKTLAANSTPFIIGTNQGKYLQFRTTDPVSGEKYTLNSSWNNTIRGFLCETEENALKDKNCQFIFREINPTILGRNFSAFLIYCLGSPDTPLQFVNHVNGWARLNIGTSGSPIQMRFVPWENDVLPQGVVYQDANGCAEWGGYFTTQLGQCDWTCMTNLVRYNYTMPKWDAAIQDGELVPYVGCDNPIQDSATCFNRWQNAFPKDDLWFTWKTVVPPDQASWIANPENKISCCMRNSLASSRLSTEASANMSCTVAATGVNYYADKQACDQFMSGFCAKSENINRDVCACFKLEKQILADPILKTLPIQIGCRGQCAKPEAYQTRIWEEQRKSGNCSVACINAINVSGIEGQAVISNLNQGCSPTGGSVPPSGPDAPTSPGKPFSLDSLVQSLGQSLGIDKMTPEQQTLLLIGVAFLLYTFLSRR